MDLHESIRERMDYRPFRHTVMAFELVEVVAVVRVGSDVYWACHSSGVKIPHRSMTDVVLLKSPHYVADRQRRSLAVKWFDTNYYTEGSDYLSNSIIIELTTQVSEGLRFEILTSDHCPPSDPSE